MTRVVYLGPSDTIQASADGPMVQRGGTIDLADDSIAVLKGAGHTFGDAADKVQPNLDAFADAGTRESIAAELEGRAKPAGGAAKQK